ncbi:MAG: hypothetical protein WCD31_12525 [Gillisia sp.]
MKKNFIYGLGVVFVLLAMLGSCTTENYSLGQLTPPSNVVINTQIVGQDADNPNGDGSGDVVISVSGDNALAYKIDYGTTSTTNLVPINGSVTKKFTNLGVNDYTLTVVAYGKGGASTNVTKDITVKSVFNPKPEIVEDLTGGSSKTWVIEKDVAGHLGVGPWEGSVSPIWYQAQPNEKADCCSCFYSASFTFTKNSNGTFSLSVSTPDGAFTKTGGLTTLPGIPAAGDEGCYSYDGGISDFSFIPSSSGIPESTPSTQTSIDLSGNSTFIGYGAVQKEYEILEITPDYLYLRVQGTETGNAWYMKLVPAS